MGRTKKKNIRKMLTKDKIIMWIDRWGNMLINLTLAIGTWYIFFLTKEQSESARISAKAAYDAVEVSKKQFEIDNIPYLVINKFDSIGFMPGKPLYVAFEINNLGKSIVELDSVRWVYTYGFNGNPLTSVEGIKNELNKAQWIKCQYYSTKEFPVKANTLSKELILNDTYNLVKTDLQRLFLGIQFHYVNLINNDERTCEIIFRLSGQDLKKSAAILKIENRSVKFKK